MNAILYTKHNARIIVSGHEEGVETFVNALLDTFPCIRRYLINNLSKDQLNESVFSKTKGQFLLPISFATKSRINTRIG